MGLLPAISLTLVRSEETNFLLFAVSLPLFEGVPFVLRHSNVLGKLFVTQVHLLLASCNAWWEAALEDLVGELVSLRVKLAGKWIICSSLGDCSLLALFHCLLTHDLRVSLEPFGGDFRLPLHELHGEADRLVASEHLVNDSLILVSRVSDLVKIFLGASDDTLLLKLVRLVTNPCVDNIVGIQDVAVVDHEILLSEGGNLFHPHVSSRVGHGEEAWLEARGEANLLLDVTVRALSAN